MGKSRRLYIVLLAVFILQWKSGIMRDLYYQYCEFLHYLRFKIMSMYYFYNQKVSIKKKSA